MWKLENTNFYDMISHDSAPLIESLHRVLIKTEIWLQSNMYENNSTLGLAFVPLRSRPPANKKISGFTV